jgi:hypothetical protein
MVAIALFGSEPFSSALRMSQILNGLSMIGIWQKDKWNRIIAKLQKTTIKKY